MIYILIYYCCLNVLFTRTVHLIYTAGKPTYVIVHIHVYTRQYVTHANKCPAPCVSRLTAAVRAHYKYSQKCASLSGEPKSMPTFTLAPSPYSRRERDSLPLEQRTSSRLHPYAYPACSFTHPLSSGNRREAGYQTPTTFAIPTPIHTISQRISGIHPSRLFTYPTSSSKLT